MMTRRVATTNQNKPGINRATLSKKDLANRLFSFRLILLINSANKTPLIRPQGRSAGICASYGRKTRLVPLNETPPGAAEFVQRSSLQYGLLPAGQSGR